MKKVHKSHLITVRLTPSTHDAIQKSQREYSSRDGAPYSLNEVARFMLNAGLHSQGQLTDTPALDGRGAKSLAHFQKSQQKAQKQVRRLAARITALKQRFDLQGGNA
jgi:hypothetical protein